MPSVQMISVAASLGSFLGGGIAAVVGAAATAKLLLGLAHAAVSGAQFVPGVSTLVAIAGGVAGLAVMIIAAMTISTEVDR